VKLLAVADNGNRLGPSLSRRKALTALIATAAVGAPAVALADAEPDPVFAAIARCRETYETLSDIGSRMEEIEERYFAECREIDALIRREEVASNEAWQEWLTLVRKSRPEATEDEALRFAKYVMSQAASKNCGLDDVEAIQEAACHASADAVIELAATVPTTPEGALALLITFREAESRGDCFFDICDEQGQVALDHVFDSIEQYLRNSKALIAA